MCVEGGGGIMSLVEGFGCCQHVHKVGGAEAGHVCLRRPTFPTTLVTMHYWPYLLPDEHCAHNRQVMRGCNANVTSRGIKDMVANP